MPNTNDDEIYFKVAADLGDIPNQFKDLSKYWDKHNQDIAKGEKAYRDYAKTTETAYTKVNQKIKENIGQVANEGKALEGLEKKFINISKKNEAAFDSKEVKEFQKVIKTLGADMSSLENLNLSVDDIDTLTQKLGATKDDFEALNVIVDFFEEKMKGAAIRSADSMDILKQKIEETQLNIASAENYIKDISKQIDDTAPGRVQAGLVGEREAATKALLEEKVALEDYKNQVKAVREENVSLGTQLNRVKDEMVKLELEGERGSDRYEELKSKAEEYRKVLKGTNEELNRSTSETAGLDNLIGAVTGVVGVFSAAEGAAALFGGESEDLGKALVKLNGAIALLNGLQAIQSELAKKDAVLTRALTYVKTQYSVATNASATATLRLGAALKLLGIGLVIGGIAALVTYWKDIAKFVGITSEKTEQLNAINRTANDLYGEQTAELKVLVEKVKEGNLSFEQKNETLKKYNDTFAGTFGTIKTYTELEKKLIEQGDSYIKYLGIKAKAEAAYQLAIEKSKQALELRTTEETNVGDYLKALVKPGTSPTVNSIIRRGGQANELEKDSDDLLKVQQNLNAEMQALADELGLVLTEPAKNIDKAYKSLADTLESLIKKQRDLKTQLIENDRDREKQLLQDQIDDEKKAYAEQIKNIKLSEDKKLKLVQEFNKLYNEETGIAYEQLRKNLKGIDDKYNAELEKVKLNALQAIDEVFVNDEERQRKAIENKFDKIREELFKQIDQTNDALQKQELSALVFGVDDAQTKETDDFDLKTDVGRIAREKKNAEALLKIFQINNKEILKNEKLKQLQLLLLEQEYLKKSLDTYRDSLKSSEEKSLFQNLIDTLATSSDPDTLKEVAEQLKKTFGEEIAQEILETVGALKEVKNELKDFETLSPFEKLVDDFQDWTNSIDSFAKKLAESLGFSGIAAKEFAEGVSFAIASTFDSLQSIFNSEIEGHREKLSSIQDTIDGVEDELEREKELYEKGYANNYEARNQDLENLKEQKKKEEEELKKAQKRKAALQKAELLLDSVSQLGNLITASTNIFKWASKIPIIGVPLAIGLIGTMFGAFAVAKTKAFQAIGSGSQYRTGLQKGRVSLSGPSHEESGFGVHNSRTGEKVAEVENNEDLIVLNKNQQRAYNHLIDAMIADSRGGTDLETSLRNHYKFSKTGPVTMGVVERVNTVIIKAQDAKGNAAKEDASSAMEVRKLREDFNREFNGHKEERESETKAWETPEFYHVKKGNTTKKYKKNK